MDKKIKKTVFISSTYNDLIEYRNAVWTLLEKYDINIKGMEAFGAHKENPLDTCLNEVSQSDIYVGIIAQRLGSIDENTGKSFTQLEYERALMEDKEILIYIINDSALISIEDVDFDFKKQKLDNFKVILRSKHTTDTFKDIDDLVKRLKTRLDDILLPKSFISTETDTFSYTKEVISKFLLFPKTYSDTEIRLKIKFNGKAFPASKEICETFGFSYARTIGVPIEIVDPELDSIELKEIFMNEETSVLYFEKTIIQEYEVTARLLFSTKKIKTIKANFFDYNKTTNYAASDLFLGYSGSVLNNFSSIHSPFEFNKERIERVEGDGTAILFLQNFL